MTERGLLLDCHIHSRFSCDSDATVEAICQAACERGLGLICLTDHVDLDPLDWGYGYFDYEGYKVAIEEAQTRWEGRLEVLGGIEVDYRDIYEEDIVRFLDDKEFDFVLGSVHACQDGWFNPKLFDAHDEERAYGLYFEQMKHLIQSDLFDCIGHLDFVKRFGVDAYGPFDVTRWAPVLEEILAGAVQHGLAIEINTSGLRQAPGETFPGLSTLELYHHLGGRILTVGTDTHGPEHVGSDIPLALDLAREAGFDSIAFFQDRQPHRIPLDGAR